MGLRSMSYFLRMILGLPGYLFYYLPLKKGFQMRDKKVKRKAFKGPVMAVTAFILSLVLHLIVFLSFGFLYSWLAAISVTIFIMISGYSFLIYWEGKNKVNKDKLPNGFFNDLEKLLQSI